MALYASQFFNGESLEIFALAVRAIQDVFIIIGDFFLHLEFDKIE